VTAPLPPEPAPTVAIEPLVRTGGGNPAIVRLTIRNDAAEPRVMLVTAMGVDAAWLPGPSRSDVIPPGAGVSADLIVRPAVGTLAGRYPFAVTVQALHPITDEIMSPARLVESELVVDAPGKIEVSLTPTDAKAVFRKRIALTVRNTGSVDADVDLAAQYPESLSVTLSQHAVRVAPNEARHIRGRLRVTPARAFGHRERHVYTITARSAGAPRHVQGALTARAMFGPGSTRAVALLSVVAVWVALALIFVPKLADAVRNRATSAEGTASSALPTPPGGGKSTSPGAPGGSRSGGGRGGGSRSAAAAKTRLSGTVSSAAPQGVTVTIHRTSLVDEAAQSANHSVGIASQAFNEVGMIPQVALVARNVTSGSGPQKMTTSADGAWSFSGVAVPGYYLVTFAKPGYNTQSYVVDAASAAAGQPLKVAMSPAEGWLSGVVLGPGGRAEGGAQITITDGTNTFTSSTNTKGGVGDWTVRGLSTPGTYLVSAVKDGLGLESRLVTLAGGGHASVTLHLRAGVATITGKVEDPTLDEAMSGIGGAQVTATDGTISRSVTTITANKASGDSQLAGQFKLPDLPVPGIYTVTVSAPGYQPQTRRIKLPKGRSAASLPVQLTSSAAVVQGSVIGATLNENGDPLPGAHVAKVGAGVTLTSAEHSYKITTASDGGFKIIGVVPGTYVLGAQYAGLVTDFRTVVAVAGRPSTTHFDLGPETVTFANANITGYVGSAVSPSGNLCQAGSTGPCELTFQLTDSQGVPVQLVSSTLQGWTTGPTQYELAADPADPNHPKGLEPGEYRLTVKATNYLPATINVQVPLDGTAVAPQLSLYPANTISGKLSGLSPLSQNPYTLQNTYTNCVWAIPLGSTVQVPSTTPCSGAQPDFTDCSNSGKPAPEYAVVDADTGTYSLDGLCDGSYTITVVITNPFFVAPSPTSSQTVSHGQTLNFSPSVPRLGRAVLTIWSFNGGSNTLGLLGGSVRVDPTCQGAPLPPTGADGLKTNSQSQVIVWGLPTGQPVTCTVSIPGDTTQGTVSDVVGALDHDVPASVTLTTPAEPAFGKVVSTWTGTRNQAVNPSASVHLSGPIGYNGSSPTPGTVDLTTNKFGCFAIVPKNFDLATLQPPTGCGAAADFDATSAAAPGNGTSSFVTAALTASIADAPGFVPLTNIPVTLSGSSAAVSTITMRPVPDTFSGSLVLDPSNATASLSGASIQVDTAGAPGAGNVLAYADSTGTLHWIDSNIGSTDAIWPGTYVLRVGLPGFQSDQATYTFTCDLKSATSPASCGPGTVTLHQLGTLSGTVTGYLGADTLATTPNQPIAAASVVLTLCTDATCTGFTTTQLRTTTDTGGNFTFAGSNGVGSLPRGSWRLQVSSAGWHASTSSGSTETHTIVIDTTNLNATDMVNMLVDPVTLQVRLTVGSTTYNPGCGTITPPSVGCPTVQLVPVRNPIPVSADPTSNPNSNGIYAFSGIIPLSGYWIYVSDPSATVQPTSQFVNVLLPGGLGQTQDVPVPIILTRNTVSGSVSGQQGKNGQTRPLNGIPVELGTGATPATFTVRGGTDGNPLTTTTANLAGHDGAFSFTTVPNGSYTALYNDPNAPGYDPTYTTLVSTDTVSVFGGQSGAFQPVVLPLSTANVAVALTPSAGSDDVSGTTLTLTNTGDSTWVLTNPQGPTTSNGTYTWTFNQVPAGNWTLTATLPSNHYGQLAAASGAPAMTCTVGSSTTPVVCTSAALSVKNKNLTVGYAVNEFAVGLSVVAVPLASDPNVTPPSTAALTVTDGAGSPNTVYSDSAFTVSSTAPATATATIWGRPGTTYTATATSIVNWPFGRQTLNATTPSTPVSLHEIGASVTVHVTLNGGALGKVSAAVSLIPPTGSGIIAPAGQNSSSDVTFTGVPFGSWTAQADATVQQGSPPQPVAVTGATPFTISSATATCTGSGASVTCSVPTVTVDMK
jgi:hypothetical protein